MALDREAIVERLPKQASKDAEVLNNRIFMPQHEAYEDHGKGYEKQDTAGAQKLLEQSGYAKGSDGIYAKNGAKLTLRLMYRDPNARRKQTAELVQAQLKEAGIDVQPTARPDFVFLDSGDFDIALFGWTGGTVLSSTTSIYVPDGGQNYTGVKNPKVRELFDQANVELDEAKRHDLMNQIDEALWEDMATVPLFQVPEVLAFRDVVKGPQYNGYQGPTWNADKWSVSAA